MNLTYLEWVTRHAPAQELEGNTPFDSLNRKSQKQELAVASSRNTTVT